MRVFAAFLGVFAKYVVARKNSQDHRPACKETQRTMNSLARLCGTACVLNGEKWEAVYLTITPFSLANDSMGSGADFGLAHWHNAEWRLLCQSRTRL